jgi:hypothetical protein
MNKKIISQEQASVRLKELEVRQRVLKAFRNHHFKFGSHQNAAQNQYEINRNKHEINLLQSIVFWHKKSKKLFAKIKKISHE